MKSAKVVSAGSGWKLRDEDIRLWSSVEFVMSKTIQVLGAGQLTSLEHVTPDWPESFGYKKLHATEKFALKSKTTCLNAFQRMLAYVSYTISEVSDSKFRTLPQQYRTFISNPHCVDEIFRKVTEHSPNSDVHVLLKFLFASVGEIFRTSNFVGVVVSYHKEYHYPSILAMRKSGVPIYVRWHETLKLDSYSTFHQHHMLKDWVPNLDAFEILNPPPLSLSSTHDPQTPSPPRFPHSPNTFLNPMDYVRQRTADIEIKLTQPDRPIQTMKDRQKAAMKFGTRSHRGANVYELERKEQVDPNTRQVTVHWERRRLDRIDAQRTYDMASPSQLWYALSLFLLLFF